MLLDGLADAIETLAAAGCSRIWVNGSFVTAKEEPADFDACWDSAGVDLDALNPVLLDLSAGRASQKARFGGELFPNVVEAQSSLAFSESFRTSATPAGRDHRDPDWRPSMITNEVQYRSTKAHLRQFDEAAAALEGKLGHADEPALARLEIDAVRAQADDLRAEIDEYEQLRSGAVSIFEAPTLAELATLLVKSRIARGWTQGQLADALGIAEQQVQRYESTAYRAASLARICDVAAALGVDISERANLRDPDAA